jgi:hypothetical protein
MIWWRNDVSAQWNKFCDEHPDAWWWHRNEWIEYCLEYSYGSKDYSAAVVDAEGIVEIEPCVLAPDINGNERHVSGGGNIGGKLTRGLSVPRSKLSSQIIYLDEWSPGQMRKSYRGLIRQQCENFNFIIIDSDVRNSVTNTAMLSDIFDAMQKIHYQEAGRVTRPSTTWGLMKDWVFAGHAAVIMAMDIWGRFYGFVYCIIYKNKAYYASGATIENCGHALQFKMIQRLQLRGLKKYELGEQGTATDQKGQNIEFFKRGFGGVCTAQTKCGQPIN